MTTHWRILDRYGRDLLEENIGKVIRLTFGYRMGGRLATVERAGNGALLNVTFKDEEGRYPIFEGTRIEVLEP